MNPSKSNVPIVGEGHDLVETRYIGFIIAGVLLAILILIVVVFIVVGTISGFGYGTFKTPKHFCRVFWF